MTAHVIALANQKGGVSKTTSTANLGAALADDGHRVLLVDFDPQANLSQMFGCDDEDTLHVEDIVARDSWPEAPTVLKQRTHLGVAGPVPGGVHMIPSSAQLADVIADVAATGDRGRLLAALGTLKDDYDFILIDTAPGISALSTLALAAADFIVIPARPSDPDIIGASNLYDMVEEGLYSQARPDNISPRILGILVTQQDRRWVLSQDTEKAAAEGDMTLIPVRIPFAVRVGRHPRLGAPTFVVEPHGRVSAAYRELATWICKEIVE